MRISTYGDWEGRVCVEERWMVNTCKGHNYTYLTQKDEEEVEIVLRLRPGITNMIIEITDQPEDTMTFNLRELKILDALRTPRVALNLGAEQQKE